MCDCLNCTDIDVPVGPQGATGPQGRAGANGTNGVAVLYNNYGETPTSSNGLWQTLDTYQIGANSLTSDGDMIEIETMFTTSSWTSATQNTRVTFNGNTLVPTTIYGGFNTNTVDKLNYIIKLTRISNTTAKYQLFLQYGTVNEITYQTAVSNIETIAGLNFTTTAYDIDVDGYSAVNGDITNQFLRVTKNKLV
jgi:hypothetical protein